MAATNKEQLEGMISSSINKEYPDYPPTEVQFDEMVTKIRGVLAPLYPVSDEEFSEIRRKLGKNIGAII